MILVGYFIALVSIPIIFTNAISVPCYTIAYGYLSASVGKLSLAPIDCIKTDFAFKNDSGDLKTLDLNSDAELTYNNGSAVQAAFQVSPRPCNEKRTGT
jgi:hypothetical protein